MEKSMNVLALVKNSERYIFLYDDESIDYLLQTLGKYASDKDLIFNWYDAAVLSQKVKRLKEEKLEEDRINNNRLEDIFTYDRRNRIS